MTTILATSAGRGIGLAFVRQYAADGWKAIAGRRGPRRRVRPQMSIG
jgi:NAD(P)-dependent dehydrogenase (short-subunit alcohol dehydrogenase family)